jgi:hypothetical protein
MLDQVAKIELTEKLWNSIPSRTELPADEEEFFSAEGVVGSGCESRRHYLRLHMRELALMHRGDQYHAVYTKDVSPKGVAVLAPMQVFPKERVRLMVDGCPAMDVEVVRCRRFGPKCYECGTVFADGVIPPALYAYFLQAQRRRH